MYRFYRIFKEQNINLDIKVNFPKRIYQIFSISVTTGDEAEINNLKIQMKEYIKWSLARFDQSLLTEAKLLDSKFGGTKFSSPLYVSDKTTTLDKINKDKAIIIIIASIILGLIIGSIIALIRNSINIRYN